MSDKKSAANAKTKYGTEYTKVDVESGVSASATGVTRGKKFNPWTSPTAVIGWLVVLVGAYVVYVNRSHGAGTPVDAAPSSSPAATEATPAPSATHYATPEPIDLTKPIPEATGDIRADIASGATNLPFGELEDEPDFRCTKRTTRTTRTTPGPRRPGVHLAGNPRRPVVLAALATPREGVVKDSRSVGCRGACRRVPTRSSSVVTARARRRGCGRDIVGERRERSAERRKVRGKFSPSERGRTRATRKRTTVGIQWGYIVAECVFVARRASRLPDSNRIVRSRTRAESPSFHD